MNNTNPQAPHGASSDEMAVRELYQKILEQWNLRQAAGMAALFSEDGSLVGFDGSQINGRTAIEQEMTRIFTDHQTGAYVGVAREVRFLSAEVALLRAVAGMVPPGQTSINPALNTVQTLVAVHGPVDWRIAIYHNTPAQFHGRPELVQQLTDELRRLL